MPDREKVFDALRNCITEPKCKDCPWETCEEFHQSKTIPLDLCLDILKLLKEQEAVVRCKDCKIGEVSELPYGEYYCLKYGYYHNGDWFCADGVKKG